MKTGCFTLIPLEEQKNLRKSSYKSKRKLDKYKKMSTLLVKATASERFFSLTLFLFFQRHSKVGCVIYKYFIKQYNIYHIIIL